MIKWALTAEAPKRAVAKMLDLENNIVILILTFFFFEFVFEPFDS